MNQEPTRDEKLDAFLAASGELQRELLAVLDREPWRNLPHVQHHAVAEVLNSQVLTLAFVREDRRTWALSQVDAIVATLRTARLAIEAIPQPDRGDPCH